MKEHYITITGMNHYYDMKPFKIGKRLKCIKEPDNDYDEDGDKKGHSTPGFFGGWNHYED